MDNSENSNKSRIDEYRELAQNSLVRVQYSCGGNSTSIDESKVIQIVDEMITCDDVENEGETKISR